MAAPILTAHEISCVRADKDVLKQVSVNLHPGEIVGLLGANGAGKSTLLSILSGHLAPASGTVLLDNKPLNDWKRRPLARKLAYLPQGHECHWPISVRRMVALGRLPGLQPWERPGRKDEEAIDKAMFDADVAHLADRPVTELSGGERARTALARTLAVGADILLADEPIAGLDPSHQLGVMELMQTSAAQGQAILAVLHDLNMAARFCHRLLVLSEGHLIADGSPSDVLNSTTLEKAFGIEVRNIVCDDVPFVIPWARSGVSDNAERS